MAEMRRVGEVSEVADITYAFFIDGMALTVRRWTEHAADGDETGARLELQRLHEDRSRGSEFAMPTVLLGAPIWRADLFRLGAGHAFERAHHHPSFINGEPCDRVWLTGADAADPFAWIEHMLTDRLESLLADAGAADLYGVATRRQLAEVLPLALQAAITCLEAPQH
ncbi:MAG TPA: hypothetical protein VND88_12340 [Candidatus Acidoferrales bacterium]|nr:hypothetical protein [Candidatus Acidoferrales bacterium]